MSIVIAAPRGGIVRSVVESNKEGPARDRILARVLAGLDNSRHAFIISRQGVDRMGSLIRSAAMWGYPSWSGARW